MWQWTLPVETRRARPKRIAFRSIHGWLSASSRVFSNFAISRRSWRCRGSGTGIVMRILPRLSGCSPNDWRFFVRTSGVAMDSQPPDLSTLHLALKTVCNFLDEHGIGYAIGGGMAVAVWGAPRATFDVDVVVTAEFPDEAALDVRGMLRIQGAAVDRAYVAEWARRLNCEQAWRGLAPS